jgi:hypothetical protein
MPSLPIVSKFPAETVCFGAGFRALNPIVSTTALPLYVPAAYTSSMNFVALEYLKPCYEADTADGIWACKYTQKL